MRLFLATIVGLVALVATSMQASSVPRKAHSAGGLHETPAENVRKSQMYDHLLSTNPRFRAYRMRKECGPIANDPELRHDCLASFNVYEPAGPRHRRAHQRHERRFRYGQHRSSARVVTGSGGGSRRSHP
jgi:hypothetical protein